MENAQRRLMWHGMFLFLLGLLTGFAEAKFANVRMGLAAHLEGVMNGIFLLALGSAWSKLQLSRGVERVAFWATLYGTYVNWLVTTFAAVFGTKALSPLTGTSHGGQPWQETMVTAGFMTVGIAILVAALLLLWGFRRVAQKA
jgi:(hydroxyamino)benzene mutase